MVHNSLQVGARQSFRAVPTAYKVDCVTVSPLSHNTQSAIGYSYGCDINVTLLRLYGDMRSFVHSEIKNTSEKGRIVSFGLEALILLAKVPYFLLTFSTFLHNTRARMVVFPLLKSFHMLYRGWGMCIWNRKRKIGWLHSIVNTIHI